MRPSCTLGIDVGTTSAKVIAIDETGKKVAFHKVSIPTEQTVEGASLQDAEQVYDAVMETLKTVVDRLTGLYVIRQIGFSAAMHSVLAVDGAGNPLSSASTWLDLRAKAQSSQMWALPAGQDIYERTGTPIHPMTMAMKLLWWKETNQAQMRAVCKFVSLKEFIWYRWFGEWLIDESMASTTGLYATGTRQWDEAMLQLTGVDRAQLSAIVPTTYCASVADSERLTALSLSPETCVNIGATDGVLANLGVGAVSADTMVVTIGTSCALRVTVRKPVTNVKTRAFCYVMTDEHYVVGAPSNSGGVSVRQMYRQVMGGLTDSHLEASFSKTLSDAATVETRGLLCLPYVAGERAPLWNPDATAAWIGLNMGHQPLHLVRAIVEGVLYNAYWIATGLFEQIGRPVRLMASGGLLEVPWIRAALADVFNIPVAYDDEGDASAVGAAKLAQLATGELTWADVGSTTKGQQCCQPDQGRHEFHRQQFERFKATAEALGLVTPIPTSPTES